MVQHVAFFRILLVDDPSAPEFEFSFRKVQSLVLFSRRVDWWASVYCLLVSYRTKRSLFAVHGVWGNLLMQARTDSTSREPERDHCSLTSRSL